MRRLGGILLFSALAIPASLTLPSTRAARGEACAMACEHGTGVACCCASGATGTSLRRCPAPGDWFHSSHAMRTVAPALPHGLPAPPLAGFLAILSAGFLLRVFAERPDPVPKPLS